MPPLTPLVPCVVIVPEFSPWRTDDSPHCCAPAFHAVQGPRLGIPQMIQSRVQFGSRGASWILAVVVFMVAVGMLVGFTLPLKLHNMIALEGIIRRVVGREISSGLTLGGILGTIGFVRIVTWHVLFKSYGAQYLLVAITVALSLVGVVMWGTVAGSMLPFILKKLRFDPASASAPFVATLVDVSGLVIYFSVAHMVLGGSLL